MFGGAGEAINLVPMDKILNGSGGRWYELEMEWLDNLEAGKSVKVDITPVYDGASTRPVSFEVKYEVGRIPQQPLEIYNTATGLLE